MELNFLALCSFLLRAFFLFLCFGRPFFVFFLRVGEQTRRAYARRSERLVYEWGAGLAAACDSYPLWVQFEAGTCSLLVPAELSFYPSSSSWTSVPCLLCLFCGGQHTSSLLNLFTLVLRRTWESLGLGPKGEGWGEYGSHGMMVLFLAPRGGIGLEGDMYSTK